MWKEINIKKKERRHDLVSRKLAPSFPSKAPAELEPPSVGRGHLTVAPCVDFFLIVQYGTDSNRVTKARPNIYIFFSSIRSPPNRSSKDRFSNAPEQGGNQ